MKLITRDDMVEYVRARLGHPVIDLELELAEKDGLGHIHLAIQDSLDYVYRNMQDEADFKDYFVLYLKAGIVEYILPDYVSDIVDANPTFGNAVVPIITVTSFFFPDIHDSSSAYLNSRFSFPAM